MPSTFVFYRYLRAKMQLSGPWKQGLKGRMLIPVGLAGASAVVHWLAGGDEALPATAMLLGFFSYKLALVVQIWNEVKVMMLPKFDVEDFLRKYE